MPQLERVQRPALKRPKMIGTKAMVTRITIMEKVVIEVAVVVAAKALVAMEAPEIAEVVDSAPRACRLRPKCPLRVKWR
jgi:hypothetical protein